MTTAVDPSPSKTVVRSNFTSTSSATLAAENLGRRSLVIYVEASSGLLHILFRSEGETTAASSTVKTLTIDASSAGQYYEAPPGFKGSLAAIFASAGTAYVTELS